ncbi:MAG TPA: cell division protein ZapB [Syntrophorhabdaceae bacterium]|nr:cell division protein ZapB [Syntrophorhabdaceae bacterium]
MELFSDNKIDELEKKIEMLITNYKTYKEEKEQLSVRLKTLENENRELRQKLDETVTERKLVLEKVMGILEKVESVDF